MKNCAIIVAARHAERWIDECLMSIDTQLPTPGWNHHLCIGVDACPATERTLMGLSKRHRVSDRHVGPYLIRNTLAKELNYRPDAYAIFDADDRMAQDYLSTLLPIVGDGIAGGTRRSMEEDSTPYGPDIPFSNGVCVISRTAWDKLGGYRPWPFAADADLIARADAMGITITVSDPNKPIYFRRIHPGSMTADKKNGKGTAARRALKQASACLIDAGLPLTIHTDTVPMRYV